MHTNDTTELSQALDELEEMRDRIVVRMAKYNRRASRQRDKMIKPRDFKKSDLIFHHTFDEGKRKPNWEGPFVILDDESKGAYRIQPPVERWNLTLGTRLFEKVLPIVLSIVM